MLPELLLFLSGHPSSLFVPSPPEPALATTSVLSPSFSSLFHPGEISSLNTLGQLAFRFAKVRSWATSTQLAARQALLSTHLPPPTPPSSDEEERRRGKKGKGRAASEAGGRAQQPPSQYLATLCSTLIGGILREYEDLIVSTEMRILKSDASFVAEGSFVPLSTLLATFNPWMAPMASLVSLVDILQAGPPSSSTSPTSPASSSTTTPDWPPGPLIDLLHSRSQIGYTHISRIYTLLSISVQRTWISHLLLFLIHGQTPSPSAPSSANPLPSLPESLSIDVGPDPSSSRRRLYKLREGSMPLFVSEATRESILYVGRAVAMSKREGREIDRGIKERMSEWVREVLPMDHRAFEGVIDRVRGEVGEWLWRNILTKKDVISAIESFGDIYLMRDGELGISFIYQLASLRHSKLVQANPSSSSSVIREQDLNLALLRASVGTASATNPALEQMRFVLEKGPVRALMPSLLASKGTSRVVRQEEQEEDEADESTTKKLGLSSSIFSPHLLGTPLHLTSTISWPLDLFLTPPALAAYSNIFAFLSALRKTHARVKQTWSSLSGAQRSRRKWTKTGEGGLEEGESRKSLARAGWGVVRLMLWFMDVLLAHFQTDVIDVQYKALLAKLQHASTSSATLPSSDSHDAATFPTQSPGLPSRDRTSLPQSPSSFSSRIPSSSSYPITPSHNLSRTTSDPRTPTFSKAPGSTTTTRTTSRQPFPPSAPAPSLDFMTLRLMHSSYLALLQDGLLMSHPRCSISIKDVLDVCERFCGLVERWGGDVLPDLLLEGLGAGRGGWEGDVQVGGLVGERMEIVKEVQEDLDEHLATFFRLLTPSSNASSAPTNPNNSYAGIETSISIINLGNISSMNTSIRGFGGVGVGKKLGGGGKEGKAKDVMERELEADVAGRRHMESLALRMDFAGWFSQTQPGMGFDDGFF